MFNNHVGIFELCALPFLLQNGKPDIYLSCSLIRLSVLAQKRAYLLPSRIFVINNITNMIYNDYYPHYSETNLLPTRISLIKVV